MKKNLLVSRFEVPRPDSFPASIRTLRRRLNGIIIIIVRGTHTIVWQCCLTNMLEIFVFML